MPPPTPTSPTSQGSGRSSVPRTASGTLSNQNTGKKKVFFKKVGVSSVLVQVLRFTPIAHLRTIRANLPKRPKLHWDFGKLKEKLRMLDKILCFSARAAGTL